MSEDDLEVLIQELLAGGNTWFADKLLRKLEALIGEVRRLRKSRVPAMGDA